MLHKKKKEKPEYKLQCECVEWVKHNFPNILVFAVANEATHKNSTYYAKSGVLKGVSDLVVILNNKVLFIEMKSPKGVQRLEQKAFQNKIENLNQKYYICRSIESFKEIIKNELN